MFSNFNIALCLRQLCCILFFITTLILTLKTAGQIPPIANDSITIAVAPAYDSVGNFHRFWLGESYRKLWAAPVPMKVFNLNKEKGGLSIIQLGGGLQSKSIRLKDSAGRQWVLRTIQKYPERGLPVNLRKTIAKDILQDQVVTGHPYAAITVPPFAGALGIPHTSPVIVYVPDDTAFGKYRTDFANSVLLFEEREPTDSLKTVNTEKVQEKVEHDNDELIDQKLVLRARLLDLLLGDWDRHEDQWRWEKIEEGGLTIYKPIPRDRDKVYYSATGVLPGLLSKQWLKSNLQEFSPKIRDVHGYNFNNRYFDRYFLNGLSERDWVEQLDYIEEKITDSLIRSAIKLMPDTIYKLSGEKIISILIERRNNLRKDALAYYSFISKYIDVPGTDKQEEFTIEYKNDNNLSVVINKIKKDGNKGRIIFSREFTPSVTKEIRLYGLDGNDIFTVKGAQNDPIKIRMIGGAGKDSFAISNSVDNKKKLIVYDRSDQANVIPAKAVTLRTSKDSAVNLFTRRTFKYDQSGPIVLASYDLDQGLQLKAGIMQIKHGFRKEPYAIKQELYAYYSTGRQSFMFTWFLDIKQVWGKASLNANITARGPHNLTNFFGVGNETVFEQTEDKEIDYYRNRFDHINGDVRLKWVLPKGFTVSAGPAIQFYTSSAKNNRERFLKQYDEVNHGEKVFSDRFYTGIVAAAERSTQNDLLLPGKGFYWQAEVRAMRQAGGEKLSFGQIHSHLDIYFPIFGDTNFVAANRIGAGTSVGDPLFFQQMQLGGLRSLRGYRTNRFTGKTMLYHNAELRFKLFDFTSYLFPGQVGMIAFNDVGRVWVPGEKSAKWHDGYGGGLYIVPVDLLLIQAIVGHSKEGTQPYISIGFSF